MRVSCLVDSSENGAGTAGARVDVEALHAAHVQPANASREGPRQSISTRLVTSSWRPCGPSRPTSPSSWRLGSALKAVVPGHDERHHQRPRRWRPAGGRAAGPRPAAAQLRRGDLGAAGHDSRASVARTHQTPNQATLRRDPERLASSIHGMQPKASLLTNVD